MVSFDIVSLFTNVPFVETINIIIKRIYDTNEINTNIWKQEMKELLYLCTKNANFTLNSKTYVQVDGVALGSPFGPVLANIFMVELEQSIIPTLSNDISQQTFQRCFNVVFWLMRCRDVGQRQINVETTLCIATLKFTTSNNAESTLCISTLT